jgi:hypothetical protein
MNNDPPSITSLIHYICIGHDLLLYHSSCSMELHEKIEFGSNLINFFVGNMMDLSIHKIAPVLSGERFKVNSKKILKTNCIYKLDFRIKLSDLER